MAISVAWHQIDTIMFDMDGTLLDLAFDNFFWREAVIHAWASAQNLSFEQAQQTLAPIFRQQEGSLNWYSLPYWSDALKLDLHALKSSYRARIALRDGVHSLLDTLQHHRKTLWLVTNAHPQVLAIKLEQTGLASYFQHIVSSHEHGYAKEQREFWQALQRSNAFDPVRTLLIDDSEPVLRAAHAYGLHVLGIEQPDSLLPARVDLHYPAIRTWSELVSGLSNDESYSV